VPGETDDRDVELMRQAAAGNRLAFDEIVERRAPAMFRFVRAIAPNDSAAEDALQDAHFGGQFSRVIESLRRELREPTPLRADVAARLRKRLAKESS
jgi:DNA-directed RNA polymerase specialized sigma24 family protein